MSGDTEDIRSVAMALYGQRPRSKVLNDVLELLLSSQWVELPRNFLPGSRLRVIRGSGMGLRHSGNLAGASFCQRAEASYAARRSVQYLYRVHGYWRYHDDILFVASDRARFLEFFQELKRRSGDFKNMADTVGSSTRFLDRTVSISAGTVSTAPTWKPTSLGTPLATESRHPMHIHRAWPRALISRLGELATSESAAIAAKERMIRRF